jgi:hypothetical protein
MSKLIRVLGVKAPITSATLARTPSLLRLFASFTERAQDTVVDDIGNPTLYLNALVSTLHLESPGVVLLLATVGIRYRSRCGGGQRGELRGVINGEAQVLHVTIGESDGDIILKPTSAAILCGSLTSCVARRLAATTRTLKMNRLSTVSMTACIYGKYEIFFNLWSVSSEFQLLRSSIS